MRTAVISLTEKGRLLSARLKNEMNTYDISRFCRSTHTDSGAENFDKLAETVAGLWNVSDALVFICACGIAVRSIAPLIRSKLTDPAVIVIDDCGRYVVPVLSGHVGGANALAKRIAEKIGAVPVITTATDTGGLFSPDCFAAANDLVLTDFKAAKHIASALLDGKPVGLVSEYEMRNIPSELVGGSEAEKCALGIYIGSDISRKPFGLTLTLMPRNIVLGIGCKKGTPSEMIRTTVCKALENAGIPWERVCAAATIDIKRGEHGLLGFCKSRGLPLVFFTAEELSAVEGDFSSSEFVRTVTGVDNVCERSAVLYGNCTNGVSTLVMRKYTSDGVTAAAAEKHVIIDFEREML